MSLVGILPATDPDAPHARSSIDKMYVPQFDPDSPAAKTVANGKGLKLEYAMQSVLASMAKGSSGRKHGQNFARRQIYNPSSDPDAPSQHDEADKNVHGEGGFDKKMQARMAAETNMEKDLKLKANLAELSPKFMPKDNSMMLDLKSSKRSHIDFKSSENDASYKDDLSISKELAQATTKQEGTHEKQALAREQAKRRLLEKQRRLEYSWIQHNWAVNGPPKKPGFSFMQNLVKKDMLAGASASKVEADEKIAMSKYDRLEESYSTWRRWHEKFGTE